VQLVFDSSTVVSYRLIGYENRTLAAENFQRSRRRRRGRAGHSVTRSTSSACGRVRAARWPSPYGSEVRLGDLRTLADSTYDVTEVPQVQELATLISRAD
jgi:hypothetical protein